jgi:hypothetical protein
MVEACSLGVASGVLKHASVGCKYGCGDIAGIISKRTVMRWNAVEDRWKGPSISTHVHAVLVLLLQALV